MDKTLTITGEKMRSDYPILEFDPRRGCDPKPSAWGPKRKYPHKGRFMFFSGSFFPNGRRRNYKRNWFAEKRNRKKPILSFNPWGAGTSGDAPGSGGASGCWIYGRINCNWG